MKQFYGKKHDIIIKIATKKVFKRLSFCPHFYYFFWKCQSSFFGKDEYNTVNLNRNQNKVSRVQKALSYFNVLILFLFLCIWRNAKIFGIKECSITHYCLGGDWFPRNILPYLLLVCILYQRHSARHQGWNIQTHHCLSPKGVYSLVRETNRWPSNLGHGECWFARLKGCSGSTEERVWREEGSALFVR